MSISATLQNRHCIPRNRYSEQAQDRILEEDHDTSCLFENLGSCRRWIHCQLALRGDVQLGRSLHSFKVVHCDLKPILIFIYHHSVLIRFQKSILINGEGNAQILDLGSNVVRKYTAGKIITRATSSTVLWQPPEGFEAPETRPEKLHDVYSHACIVYKVSSFDRELYLIA